MRVAVTRSGGFAGLVLRAETDTEDQPALSGLIDEADLDDLPEPRPEPDRFVYAVEVGDRSVRIAESDLRGPLRELVDYVMAHGRRPDSPPTARP